ncbi:MAG: cytochrome b/b6 domain-containing protein [Litoreibacter sp.]
MIVNSKHTYGGLTKMFHWLTAFLIITLIPLGFIAQRLPYETSEQLSQKAWLFSLHKTLGIAVFLVAVLRIIWALIQPKPGLLNANKRFESWLAETIHWLLYASLVLVPLTGWVHHSATTGFAAIWPPISNLVGQSLPLVPKSETVAHIFSSLHIIFGRVLALSLLLHIAGALKHHFIDRDLTLQRMLPGVTTPDIMPKQHPTRAPIYAALGIYVVAMGVGVGLGLPGNNHDQTTTPQLADVTDGWKVEDGSLSISVRQLGSDVLGSFAEWTAAINFSETPDADGMHGDVEVTIAIGSLTLGSVTGQALTADFLSADVFPTASFTAPITSTDGQYFANGSLELKGATASISLPFTLDIDGDTATMSAQTTLNRINFNVGEQYPNEDSVGFDVLIDVSLVAMRRE